MPWLRRQRWKGWLLVLPTGVGTGQVLGEGFRWQMVPAYVLALALPVAWMLRRTMVGRFTVRRWIIHAAKIASLAVCSIVFLASVALPVAVPVFHFPSPTGRYGIGTTTYHWADTTRPEPITADTADHRELIAQVWYPATPAPGATRAPTRASSRSRSRRR